MIGVVCWFLSRHTNPGFLLFVALLLEQILACTTCCKNTCWKTSILGKTRYIIHPSIIRPSVPTSFPPFHSLGAIKHPFVFLSVLPFDPSIFRFSLRLSISPLSPIHSRTHSLARSLACSPAMSEPFPKRTCSMGYFVLNTWSLKSWFSPPLRTTNVELVQSREEVSRQQMVSRSYMYFDTALTVT